MKINITIGRSSECDLVIQWAKHLRTDTVSRKHLLLSSTETPGKYRIEDLRSTRGTSVQTPRGWIKVPKAVVDEYSKIKLGEYETTPAALINAWKDAPTPSSAAPLPPVPSAGVSYAAPHISPEQPQPAQNKGPWRDPITGEIINNN